MQILVFFALILSAPAFAEIIGDTAPARPVVVPTQQIVNTPGANGDDGKTMLKFMQELMKANQRPTQTKQQRDIEDNYNKNFGPDFIGPSDFTPTKDAGAFAGTAMECGLKGQRECAPSRFGGRTMCGRAVAQMIKCMAPSIGGSKNCNGGCGHGKDFVNCQNKQMAMCGYAKLPPTDARCKQAGAVLGYSSSPTPRGKIYGHVEFVCGENKYCSVYSQPHDRPWPKAVADSCWFPGTSGGAAP